MSIVQNPLIGAARKSMGNATFSTWKGVYVLKTKPVSVANPQTDAQQMQRNAFAMVVAAFRQMPAVVRAGYKKLAVKKSEFNAFASQVLKEAFNYSTPPNPVLLPESVLISKGTIAKTEITTAVSDRSSNTITVNWSSASLQPGQSTTDRVLIAAYNETQNVWTGIASTVLRSANTASAVLPTGWATGNALTVYLGFYNPLTGESSDSDAIADTIVA